MGSAREILLIDDEQEILDFEASLLRNAGFVVKTAKNGAEAMSYLASGSKPDVIVTDWMMPKMDGADLVAGLAKDEALKTIPVIVVSGAFPHDLPPPGIRVVIAKPFSPQDLLLAVRAHCLNKTDL